MYDRLKYNGEDVAKSIGYTQGAGSFHIPERLFNEITAFLEKQGIDVARGYGNGPSRKIRLMEHAFRYLRLADFSYHGIRREFYLFPLVKNLTDVIQQGAKPDWVDRHFVDLARFWKARWAIPRSASNSQWKEFRSAQFMNEAQRLLSN
jgi:hypothetical protein